MLKSCNVIVIIHIKGTHVPENIQVDLYKSYCYFQRVLICLYTSRLSVSCEWEMCWLYFYVCIGSIHVYFWDSFVTSSISIISEYEAARLYFHSPYPFLFCYWTTSSISITSEYDATWLYLNLFSLSLPFTKSLLSTLQFSCLCWIISFYVSSL